MVSMHEISCHIRHPTRTVSSVYDATNGFRKGALNAALDTPRVPQPSPQKRKRKKKVIIKKKKKKKNVFKGTKEGPL